MILYRWHEWVGQPKEDEAWHREDIADELQEYAEAKTLIEKWSELSDVVYTVTRARWCGHSLEYPINKRKQIVGLVYMYPKYTSRVLFLKSAGKKEKEIDVERSDSNPRKVTKL